MPTPFYHLEIAETLLVHPGLSKAVRTTLIDQRNAFLFGNTAPDVQVVSGQKRQATHFFTLPIRTETDPPWSLLFSSYPTLARPSELSGSQAAFLAGYLCHLQADWYWIRLIFFPIFGPECSWGRFPERLYLHNVLRSYLDMQVIPELPARTAARLKSVQPRSWLPFVEDHYLVEWRDFLAGQLEPGATARTVEVFAARQGISPEEFYSLLESEERMEKEVFNHLPRRLLQVYRQQLIDLNQRSLDAYFKGKGWITGKMAQFQVKKPEIRDEVSP